MHPPAKALEQFGGAGLWDKVVTPRQILDTCAENGWLLSTPEIAEIIGIDSGAITTRGKSFVHEVWTFNRVRRQGNCIVWRVAREKETA